MGRKEGTPLISWNIEGAEVLITTASLGILLGDTLGPSLLADTVGTALCITLGSALLCRTLGPTLCCTVGTPLSYTVGIVLEISVG